MPEENRAAIGGIPNRFEKGRRRLESRPLVNRGGPPPRVRARAKSPWRLESLTRIDRCNDKWKRARRGGTGPGCRWRNN